MRIELPRPGLQDVSVMVVRVRFLQGLRINNELLLGLKNIEEDKWKVYTKAVKHYKVKRWGIYNFTKRFIELVKAGASKEQLEVYTEAVKYHKGNVWEIDGFTKVFAELVKAKPTKDQLEVYTEAVKYHKGKRWGIYNFTKGFTELVKTGASKEQLEVYTEAVKYYEGNGWIDSLTKGFTELVKKYKDDKEYWGLIDRTFKRLIETKAQEEKINQFLALFNTVEISVQDKEKLVLLNQLVNHILGSDLIECVTDEMRELIIELVKERGEEAAARSHLITLLQESGLIKLEPNEEGGQNVVLIRNVAKVKALDLDKALEQAFNRLGGNFSKN